MKKKLNVYYLETGYRVLNFMDVFVELIIYLQEKYDVNLVTMSGKDAQLLNIPKYDCNLPDCELLIEDEEEDVIRLLSFSESRSALFEKILVPRNNKNDILMFTQYHRWFPLEGYNLSDEYNFKVVPTTYYTLLPTINYNYWYRLRRLSKFENWIDQMFCLTTTERCDVPRLRDIGYVGESPGPLSLENYLSLAIQYKVGLSIHGVAEVCHREFEYMAIGVPNLRIEYMTQLNPPLIPNHHYISIDVSQFPRDGQAHRLGGEEYVNAYVERFNQVRNDKDFLHYIAENGRQYYLENCSDQNRLKHILNGLEL